MSLEALTTEALAAIAAAQDLAALDQARVQFTGKKSQLAEQSKALGKMDPEERKVQGAAIHAVREAINAALIERQQTLQQAELAKKLASEIDKIKDRIVKDMQGKDPKIRRISTVWEVFIL